MYVVMKLFKFLDEVVEAPEVDAGLGLVKESNLCLACECHCDLDTLELTARKRSIDLTVDIITGAQTHAGKVFAGFVKRDVVACSERDQVFYGDAFKSHGLLESKADP